MIERMEGIGQNPELQEKAETALEALGLAVSTIRSDFIKGRKESGIEDIWDEDEQHYNGVDEFNNAELSAWGSKPLGQAVIDTEEEAEEGGNTGSTIFVNITAPYVDAASARVADMLLPVDGDSWDFSETPYPELVPIAEGKLPEEMEEQLNKQFADNPEGRAQRAALLQKKAQAEIQIAREKAKKAKKRIQDWHVEHNYHGEVRKVIESSSKLGTGIMKGPIPRRKKKYAYSEEEGTLIISNDISPASFSIDPRNFYPDPSCGQDIQNGQGVLERDELARRKLRDLAENPGYFQAQVRKCLDEGAHKAVKSEGKDDGLSDLMHGLTKKTNDKNMFEIWYYYGELTRDELIAVGFNVPEDKDAIPVQITMVNNRIIKLISNPLDSGEFPYDVMPWKAIPGFPWGVGISRQVRTPQRVVNAASRNMMDNAGRASGPQVLFKDGVVEPENNVYEIVPWKLWRVGEDIDMDNARAAIEFVTVDMFQPQMEAIINWALRMAEDVTGMPMIMQGQTNDATPDTYGGMALQNENSNTVLRRIGRLYDDNMTEPQINRYYAYLLQYGPDDEKGEFIINAKGSTALVERQIANEKIGQLAAIVKDPVFGIDPKKYMKQWFAANRLDSSLFEYDDDQWRQIVEQLAQPPQDSAVQVAEIRAASAENIAQMNNSAKVFIEDMRKVVAEAEQQLKERMQGRDLEVDLLKEAMSQDLESMLEGLKQEGLNKRTLDEIKGRIGETVMKLDVQKLLSGTNAATPIVEPKGRAEEGKAFEQ